MQTLDTLYEYASSSEVKMILVMTDDSKDVAEHLFNVIYKKATSKKVKIDKCKGLTTKISMIKNKMIGMDIDFKKIQIGSSTAAKNQHEDLLHLKSCITDNNSKMLFKAIQPNGIDRSNITWMLKSYDVFDLIIHVDEEDIRIMKCINLYTPSRYLKNDRADKLNFPIEQLVRSIKMKKIQNSAK